MSTALGRAHHAPPRPQLWHLTERSAFAALRQSGRRARRGAVTVTWLGPVTDTFPQHPRVAFAIGRPVGNAVVRNRIRRRLRAALHELQIEGALPQGSYLVGGRTELAQQPWEELVATLRDAVTAATSEVAR